MMKFRRGTWIAIALAAVVFAALNFHPWRPGIGERTDRINGVQPVGSELELYYGWPACYRAELLRSDDPDMGDRVLKASPFYAPPYAEGWVSSRYVGRAAMVLDASVALLGLVLTAVIFECERRKQWNRASVTAVLIMVAVLAAAYWVADMVDAHL